MNLQVQYLEQMISFEDKTEEIESTLLFDRDIHDVGG